MYCKPAPTVSQRRSGFALNTQPGSEKEDGEQTQHNGYHVNGTSNSSISHVELGASC